jgi:hypothetical protein
MQSTLTRPLAGRQDCTHGAEVRGGTLVWPVGPAVSGACDGSRHCSATGHAIQNPDSARGGRFVGVRRKLLHGGRQGGRWRRRRIQLVRRFEQLGRQLRRGFGQQLRQQLRWRLGKQLGRRNGLVPHQPSVRGHGVPAGGPRVRVRHRPQPVVQRGPHLRLGGVELPSAGPLPVGHLPGDLRRRSPGAGVLAPGSGLRVRARAMQLRRDGPRLRPQPGVAVQHAGGRLSRPPAPHRFVVHPGGAVVRLRRLHGRRRGPVHWGRVVRAADRVPRLTLALPFSAAQQQHEATALVERESSASLVW